MFGNAHFSQSGIRMSSQTSQFAPMSTNIVDYGNHKTFPRTALFQCVQMSKVMGFSNRTTVTTDEYSSLTGENLNELMERAKICTANRGHIAIVEIRSSNK